ncbi:MAG: autotransporter outer membrane beta-barrel domain-containing protein, partial [Sphingomonadaceae bacterium]
MTQLGPEAYLTPLKLHYQASDRFRRVLTERGLAGIEDKNGFAAIDYHSFTQKSRPDQYAANAEGFAISAGGNVRIGEDWRLFGGLGYRRLDNLNVTEGPPFSGAGDAMHAGVGAAWLPERGPDIIASLSAGWQWLETRRDAVFLTPGSGLATPESRYLQMAVSIGHTIRAERAFLRPSFDVVATGLTQFAFAEEGLAGLGAAGDRSTQLFWSVQPQLAGGFTLAGDEKLKAEFQARVGGVLQLRDAITMPYRLVGASAAADPAQLQLPLNGQGALLGADLVLTSRDRVSLSAGFTTVRGGSDRWLSGDLRLLVRF